MNMTARLILLKLKSFEKEASVQAAVPTETPAILPAIGSLKAAQWEQILSWTLAQLSTSADGMDGMGDLTPNTQNILTGLHTTHVKALNAIGLAGVDAYSKKLDAQLKPRLHESVNVMGRFVSDELRKTVIKELVLLEPVAELLLRFVEEVNQQVRASAPGIPYTRRFKEGIEGQIGPWSERQAISRTFFLRYGNHDVANFLFDQWRAVCAALGMQIPESAPLGPPERAQEDDNSSSDSD
jgi:hypothetical protein